MGRNGKTKGQAVAKVEKKGTFFQRLKKDLCKNWILYVMILPVVIYYVVFAYAPMYGIQLAFKNYRVKQGIWGSPWVGFEHFQRFFSAYNFKQLIGNTIGISVYSILVGFPIPIIFALMLNYLKNKFMKKTVQMVSYAPYFISTVVMCGMIAIFLNVDTGIFNTIRNLFGLESVDFLAKAEWFKSIYVWTGVWQGMGWGTIIYLAAITGISGELYEAAMIDGANRWQRMWNITLPGIRGTVVTLLIMNLGKVMGSNYERLDQFGNTQVKDFSYQLAIYIYDKGLASAKFSMATAVGIFQSLVGLVLVLLSDRIAKMLGEEGLL